MTRKAIAAGAGVLAVVSLLAGCGGRDDAGARDAAGAHDAGAPDATTSEGVDSGFFSPFGAADAAPTSVCGDDGSSLFCPRPPCTTPTSLTGVVLDPAGKNPVYGAVVYVPNAKVPPMVPGTSTCSSCIPAGGDPVVATVTAIDGTFTLDDAPAANDLPLVVQAGKWRRQVIVPTVHACQANPLPPDLTRLPRNQSEGDLPQMALLTGACDGLGCLLARVGVDPREFTGPDAGGRVHVYRGAGPGPDLQGGGGGTAGDCTGTQGACPLWSTKAQLERYDRVLLGCECGENNQTKPDMTPMHDWLDEGGQVLAVHNQETWFKNGPPDFQSVVGWDAGPAPGPFAVDRSFVRGMDLSEWLDASTVALPAAALAPTMRALGTGTAAWLYDPSTGPTPAAAVDPFVSFSTPTVFTDGGTPGCGRVTITDVHVGSDGTSNTAPVPASCTAGDLTPDEKILEFLLLSDPACDTQPPKIGPPIFGDP